MDWVITERKSFCHWREWNVSTRFYSDMKKIGLLSSVLALGVSPLSAEVKLSEKLTRIAGHLGEGGVHFSVTDAQEDLRDLAQLGDTIMKNVPDLDLP